MPLFISGDPIDGTDGRDYIFGQFNGPDNTINGLDGNDIIIGDSGSFFNAAGNNATIATASIADGSGNWNKTGSPMIADSLTIPHTTLFVLGEAGTQEFYSVTIGAGETLNAETDFSSFDTVLTFYLSDGSGGGTLIGTNDNHDSVDAGSEGSFLNGTSDSHLSYVNTTAGAQTIIIRVGESELGQGQNSGNLDGADDTTLLNISITGHAATGTLFTGNDTVDGGDGNDTIFGLGGDDMLMGGMGNDVLSGGGGDDIIDGGDGVDTVIYELGTLADYTIVDNMDGTFSVTANSGTEGTDTLSNIEFLQIGGENIVFGDTQSLTEVRDVFVGDASDDLVFALGGNDAIRGEGGNDTLYGGSGADNLRGGEGEDSLFGESGNDRLFGDAGDDTISGGDGIDLIFGSEGNDLLDGNGGVDKFFGGIGDDLINGGAGNDVIFGDDGDDVLNGGTGNDRLIGRNDDDILLGDAGDDKLKGGNGNDQLYGGGDNDTLSGNGGTDILNGGAGNDQMFGGSGVDTFVFDLADGAGTDRVNDFEAGETVQLNGFGFADAAAAASSFVQFGLNVKFTNGGVTIIFVDANVADIRAAVAVDGNAEAPGAIKLITNIAEDFLADTGLQQDVVADFLMAQSHFSGPRAMDRIDGQYDHASVELDYDWDALAI